MAFRNGCYANIWELKPSTNYTDARVSTSRRVKDTGAYENDFSGFVRFIGTAHRDIQNYPSTPTGSGPIVRLKLDEVSATQTYNKEKQRTYTGFQCYAFSPIDSSPKAQAAKPAPNTDFVNVADNVTDEELPFN